jgi:hypothetical protein
MEYYAGMFHIEKTEYDHIEKTLIEEYSVGGYLIGHEAKPYSHFHILAQFPNKKLWTNYQKHLIERYHLRGKPKNGKPRQYGAIKTIRDLEKLKSYTIKDGDYRSNLSESDLKQYFDKSFKKENDKTFCDELIEHLDNIKEDIFKKKHIIISTSAVSAQSRTIYEDEIIKKLMIQYALTQGVKTSRIKVQNWYTQYIERTDRLTQEQKLDYLYKYYFK